MPCPDTWNVCRPVAGGMAWQEPQASGGMVVVVVGAVVAIVVETVVATVVVTVVGIVVGTVVGCTVVVAVVVGTIVVGIVVDAVVVDATVVGVVVDVGGGAFGSGFGSATFQLRPETGKLMNPAEVTVKLPRNVYAAPVIE